MPDSSPRKPRFSRRAFLKGASVVAAGGAVGNELVADSNVNPSTKVLGAGDVHEIELSINGEKRKLKVETRTTLLDALRGRLDMTGSKKVCDRGACGGCTVMLDGEIATSCMVLAFDAVGHEITTIEGIGTPEKLHPMQKAFVECDALQCGFCTPGMVVSAVACVNKHGKPSDEQMRREMSGNICRCGTYTRVFEAIQKASGGR